MAFSFPTETAFKNRYNSLPEVLHDTLESAQTKKVLDNISAEHRLDDAKQQALGALTAFVLLGFLAKSELTHEIGEQLFLNHEHSRALADEINARVLDSVKEELEEVYNPYGDETEVEEEGEEEPEEQLAVALPLVPLAEISGEKIQVSAIGEEETTSVSLPISEDNGPMVIQKSASFFEKPVERVEQKRSFSPFNMFASSPESVEAKPAVKVKIESPRAFSWPFEKKTEEKVVHYSEAHSSLSPALSSTPEGFIHLEALQNTEPNTAGVMGEATKPTVPEPTPTTAQLVTIPITTGPMPAPSSTPTMQEPAPLLSENGPSLEGNIVHLK